MNRLVIDRLDIALPPMDAATAEAVRRELPDALQRRLAHAGALRAHTASVDLGRLNLPRGLPPRALADAIALRLAHGLQAGGTEGR